MKHQKKHPTLNSHSHTAVKTASSAIAFNSNIGYVIGKLPREFERSIVDYFDRRFMAILLCTFIVHFSTVFYFLSNPPVEEFSKDDISRIQRQFASLVLEHDIVSIDKKNADEGIANVEGKATAEDSEEDAEDEETKSKSEKKSKSTTETKTATVEERKESRGNAVAARKRSREAISQEVSNKGVLGLLTASGGGGTGAGVVDILGDVGANTDNIGDVLNELDGLKTGGTSIRGGGNGTGGSKARGVRTASGGSIDNLVGDLATASSGSVSRKGKLAVTPAPVIIEEPEGGGATGSRDPDDVSEVVNRHNAAVQACYQRELKRNPNLKGKIVIRFTIMPNGKVKNVKIVSSTINNKRVERCILNRVRRWDDFGAIDPSKGNTTFRQVYTFGH